MAFVLCPSCGATFSTAASYARPVMLQSWKEIASYLGIGVRTVQRWEQECGFPVHRTRGSEQPGSVFALPQEIDEWLRSKPVGVGQRATAPQNGNIKTPAA